jgi:hypothetical protein
MPASEAQIRASKANGARSKGPSSPEGKEKSRANSYKHGLTATVVLPEQTAAEVQRRFVAFATELEPTGEVSQALTLHAARMSVRMEVCANHETAMLTERVRQALAEIEYPEGVTEAEAFKIRAEVTNRAMFDTSREATLARKYEASAVRGFFNALKELRLIQKQAKAAKEERIEEQLGSFLPGEMTDEDFDRLEAEFNLPTPRKAGGPAARVDLSKYLGGVDVPIAIGERR